MIARLSFAALLVLSTSAWAQETPPPVIAPSAPEAAALLAATGRVETAGRALEAALEDLKPRLAAVDADAGASDAVRVTRKLNLVAGRQMEIEALAEAVHDLVLEQALAQGTAREEAEALAATVRTRASTAITSGLVGGTLDEDDD